jgi:tol-pal system protein YbgF
MKALRGQLTMTSAVLAVSAVLFGLMTWPASAGQTVTIDGRDLVVRMQRMERDIRDLQAETFRRPPDAAAPQAGAPPAAGTPDLGPIMRRMDEFGDSISRLTGQMEELGHQVDLLSQKADRLQKEMDYQRQQPARAQTSAPMPGDAAAGEDAVASIAPSQARPPRRSNQPAPGVLGQIPADEPLPVPGGATPLPPPTPAASDSKGEFDSAMNLLSRAQYVPASEAFRAFADAHPDDERASQALYWAGDIAYSAKKDYEEAARNFAELLKKYPMAPRAPEGMLKLGLALLELDQMKEGCAALAALPAKYPNASPTIAARARNERRDNKCR